MKRTILCSLPFLGASLAFPALAYDDQYEYIQTPDAEQISDLTDDDRDGVVNARDLCPDTPIGAQIDNDGCSLEVTKEEERQLRILFANDSYDVSPVFSDQISAMADFMDRYRSASIEIQGYASKTGNPDYNVELSKKRAVAVEELLLSYGLNPERVTIVGFGATHLESTGEEETDHALNRRVTATVVGLTETVVEEWTIFSAIDR
ncbi:OmpA family protein [Vibrio coralliilyticus]|uniref:OmpA family protein n=1 Tax=Vibrio coralliilyticus TaxID=190893 RepID=UPI001E494E2F|nr:OmpA family protein [Vibrio coralliilyticus]MCC2523867.1 OmpA family protein [Vibrio coralliilyticus]